ncbi:MAG: cytochrome P450 [Gemmatimonadetes bacterium]|nr:cytochrome P450 [Gemmatimonadota bacterium]
MATAAPPARPLGLPPGPGRLLPGQMLLRLRREGLLTVMGALAAEYGDIVCFQVPGERFVLLNHPDQVRDMLVTHQKLFKKGRGLERTEMLLGRGLLTSEGELHLRQRRLAQPAFHRQRIAGYGDVMAAYARRHADAWQHGETRDMSGDMMRLTLAIAGKTLFDADVEQDAAEIGRSLTDVFEAWGLALLPLGHLLIRLPIPAARRFKRAKAVLDATIYRMIADRRAAPGDRGDLLSMLMAATDTEGDGTGMSDEQLRDECMTIFLAGHETTANALTWAWYLLSQHPEVEARLHAEVDRVLVDRPATAADLAQLPCARMVFAETLRLYPPAYALGRRALVPYDVGGYRLPAGTVVLSAQYLSHRDPRWWSEPEAFRPERWAEGSGEPRNKFAYVPFGAGTRVCIGEQFAWMEGTLVLAEIARRWRFRHDPTHVVALQPQITLRPKHGMRMTFERRR